MIGRPLQKLLCRGQQTQRRSRCFSPIPVSSVYSPMSWRSPHPEVCSMLRCREGQVEENNGITAEQGCVRTVDMAMLGYLHCCGGVIAGQQVVRAC